MHAELTRRLPSFLINKTQDKDIIAERQYCRGRREAKEQVGQMFIAKHIFRQLLNEGIWEDALASRPQMQQRRTRRKGFIAQHKKTIWTKGRYGRANSILLKVLSRLKKPW